VAAQVHMFSEGLKRVAAAGVLLALAGMAVATRVSAQTAVKKYKDGEYEAYLQAVQDVADPAKTIADLDAWARAYGDSDYREDRQYLYLQAYQKLNQPVKVLEIGSQIMSRDLARLFSGPPGKEQLAGLPIRFTMLNALFSVALSSAGIPDATPEQMELGERAARQLLELAPRFFTAENKPRNESDEDWSAARAEMENKARAALFALALKPGLEARRKGDCPSQETAFRKAFFDHPESGAISYQLGLALISCAQGDPEKTAQGLWEIARAAALHPAASALSPKDVQGIDEYLIKVYTRIHGSEDGLDELRKQALGSPAPPAGFRVQTADEAAREKQAEFERSNPQQALWAKIRGLLAQSNGERYFQGQLKDVELPRLRGQVLEGTPACRSRELLVAVSDASRPGIKAEITLKLDTSLTGMADAGEVQWIGVPSAFSKEPFMLTMETAIGKIEGLRVSPCAPSEGDTARGTAATRFAATKKD